MSVITILLVMLRKLIPVDYVTQYFGFDVCETVIFVILPLSLDLDFELLLFSLTQYVN